MGIVTDRLLEMMHGRTVVAQLLAGQSQVKMGLRRLRFDRQSIAEGGNRLGVSFALSQRLAELEEDHGRSAILRHRLLIVGDRLVPLLLGFEGLGRLVMGLRGKRFVRNRFQRVFGRLWPLSQPQPSLCQRQVNAGIVRADRQLRVPSSGTAARGLSFLEQNASEAQVRHPSVGVFGQRTLPQRALILVVPGLLPSERGQDGQPGERWPRRPAGQFRERPAKPQAARRGQ